MIVQDSEAAYPQDAVTTPDVLGLQDRSDVDTSRELPDWMISALDHPDVRRALQDVCKGQEAFMQSHPRAADFVEALRRRHLFDANVIGRYDVTRDMSVDTEGFGEVSFVRSTTDGMGYVVKLRGEQGYQSIPIEEVLPVFADYHPNFERPTGLFRGRLTRNRMIEELNTISLQNRMAEKFWGAFLTGLFEGEYFPSHRHHAMQAYITQRDFTGGGQGVGIDELQHATYVNKSLLQVVKQTYSPWDGSRTTSLVSPLTRSAAWTPGCQVIDYLDNQGGIKATNKFMWSERTTKVMAVVRAHGANTDNLVPQWTEVQDGITVDDAINRDGRKFRELVEVLSHRARELRDTNELSVVYISDFHLPRIRKSILAIGQLPAADLETRARRRIDGLEAWFQKAVDNTPERLMDVGLFGDLVDIRFAKCIANVGKLVDAFCDLRRDALSMDKDLRSIGSNNINDQVDAVYRKMQTYLATYVDQVLKFQDEAQFAGDYPTIDDAIQDRAIGEIRDLWDRYYLPRTMIPSHFEDRAIR